MASEWKEAPLSELCSYINRGSAPEYSESRGMLVLNQKCIRTQRVNYLEARYTDHLKKPIAPERMLQNGDVLVNSTGVGTLGRVAQIEDLSEPSTVDSHITILRPNPQKIFSQYFGLAIRSFEKDIEALGEGSTGQTELARARLAAFIIPIPPLSEQRAIAHILGTLDDKIELNRRMNETLEAMARALFKSWFVDFDPVRAKAEGRWKRGQSLPGLPANLYDLFPDSFEDSALGEIPKGWRVQSFADTVDIIGGGTPKTSVTEYWGGTIPWFSVVDAPPSSEIWVIDTEKKVTQKGVGNSSTRLLPIGTTILSARGTVGRVALVGVPMAMNQSCYGLQGKQGQRGYFNYFATCVLVSVLQQRAHGSVFDTITRDTLAGILSVVPTSRVVIAFEEFAGAFIESIKRNVLQSRTLSIIRDVLLPKLISGELHVKDAEKYLEHVQ